MNQPTPTQLSPALIAFFDDVRHWATVARDAEAKRAADDTTTDEQPQPQPAKPKRRKKTK